MCVFECTVPSVCARARGVTRGVRRRDLCVMLYCCIVAEVIQCVRRVNYRAIWNTETTYELRRTVYAGRYISSVGRRRYELRVNLIMRTRAVGAAKRAMRRAAAYGRVSVIRISN